MPSKTGPDPGAYRVLERTVEVHGDLAERQLAEVARIAGRDVSGLGRSPLLDVPPPAEAEDLLDYLRAERISHTIAEERRWDP